MSDKKACCVRVYPATRFGAFQGYNCRVSATVEHEGKWYCKTHSPAAKAARIAKSDAKYARQVAALHSKADAKKETNRKAEAYPELVNMLKAIMACLDADERDAKEYTEAQALLRDLGES